MLETYCAFPTDKALVSSNIDKMFGSIQYHSFLEQLLPSLYAIGVKLAIGNKHIYVFKPLFCFQ